jgi:HKD family nuclease
MMPEQLPVGNGSSGTAATALKENIENTVRISFFMSETSFLVKKLKRQQRLQRRKPVELD